MARGSILPRRLKNGEARYDVTIELPPVNGKRRQEYKTFKTKREAAAYLNARLGEIEKGVVVEKSKMTVADLMADYLNDARATTRPTTLASYEHTIRKHILPALGPVPVQKLTPLELKKFYADLDAQLCAAARGRRVLQLCHFHIRKPLKQAVRLGLVARNVADLVTQPQERPGEMQTWSAEEAQAFLAVADQSGHGPLWLLALTTGLRRGELLGLRWKDVDLERGMLHVRQTVIALRGHAAFSQPKTPRSRRSAALLDPVTLALREHKRRQNTQRLALGATWQDHDLVFCTGLGTPIKPDKRKRDYDRLVALAGVPRIRIHDVRHTFTTHALAHGANVKAVSETIGHADVGITLRTYAHVLPEQRREVAAKVSAAFFPVPVTGAS
jgi:integrase